jgi:lysozyme
MPRFIVSPTGRALIERNEGLRLDAYPDPVSGGDPWTIGYGDTGPDVVPGLRITKEDAIARLTKRLNDDFGENVNEEIGDAPTTQAQFDAMVSLAYNIGNGGVRHRHGTRGFDGSSVLREHLAGNYQAAGDAFLRWNMAGGRVNRALTRRRNEERLLYLSDLPSGAGTAPSGIPTALTMQQMLAAAGENPGPADGIWGPRSAAALASYYRKTR